jgi:hypothetical protein
VVRNEITACPSQIAHQNLTTYMGRSCIYEKVHNWLNVNADAYVLQFQHSLTDTQSKPPCAVRRFGDPEAKDLAVLKAGQAQANLSQWLTWAGVDLDRDLDAEEGSRGHRLQPDAGGRYPKLRSTGLHMTVRVMYFNYGLAPGLTVSSDIKCIIEVRRGCCVTECMTCIIKRNQFHLFVLLYCFFG